MVGCVGATGGGEGVQVRTRQALRGSGLILGALVWGSEYIMGPRTMPVCAVEKEKSGNRKQEISTASCCCVITY